jgi:hypothetical protein
MPPAAPVMIATLFVERVMAVFLLVAAGDRRLMKTKLPLSSGRIIRHDPP